MPKFKSIELAVNTRDRERKREGEGAQIDSLRTFYKWECSDITIVYECVLYKSNLNL